eukprot:951402-Rhodomonas_salina.1
MDTLRTGASGVAGPIVPLATCFVGCADEDECAAGDDDCDANAACENSIGSFSCACNAGYSGTGVTCANVNECVLGTDDCHAEAACTDTIGSFDCACNAGYSGNGVSCAGCEAGF